MGDEAKRSGEREHLDVAALLVGTTPGPWWVIDDLDTDDDPAIGIAYGMPSDDGSPFVMVAITPGSASYEAGDQADKEANARLIAAAPSLAREVLRLRAAIAGHRSTKRSPGCGHALHEADNRLWSVVPDPDSGDLSDSTEKAHERIARGEGGGYPAPSGSSGAGE